jgi:glycosyltransferase involved in cell wall biosynthesis
MVSNLDLVRRLGCYSAVLYFSTEAREPLPSESALLTECCDCVAHGGKRMPQQQFSKRSLISHKLDFLLRGGLGLAGRRYPFSMRYDIIGAESRILGEARRTGADFVVLPSFMVHYAPALHRRGIHVIADAIDVLTELTGRLLASFGGHGLGRLGLYANFLASRTQEEVFLPFCREVWATSPGEAAVLSRMAPKVKVLAVANTLDEHVYRPGPLTRSRGVGFIGTYSSAPNLEAALFLAEQVFPLVVRQFADARLTLAGAGMPEPAAARLRRLPYVDLAGELPNSAGLFEACRVMALPVFVRGGVPLKLVEALARGKPVVASPELVDGLPVRDGHDLLIRSRAADFAEGIGILMSDDELCQDLGKNGRATFLQNWSRAHAEQVLRASSALAGPWPDPRPNRDSRKSASG